MGRTVWPNLGVVKKGFLAEMGFEVYAGAARVKMAGDGVPGRQQRSREVRGGSGSHLELGWKEPRLVGVQKMTKLRVRRGLWALSPPGRVGLRGVAWMAAELQLLQRRKCRCHKGFY